MSSARLSLTRAAIALVAGAFIVLPAQSAVAAAPTIAPVIISPAYNANSGSNPILQWSAVSTATKYRVQISTTSSFSNPRYSVDTYGLHATPPEDLPVGSLYWRVAGTDGGSGIGPYSTSQFVKRAMAGPTLSSPANQAILTYPTQTPVLRWSALASVKGYKVELDDADDFVGAQSFTTSNTSLALSEPLILGKTYYWHVQGLSDTTGVVGAFSTTWSFRVDWPATTGKPILLAPANDPTVDVTDVVFRWQPVAGAKSYQIQVSPNPDFANNITDDRVVKGTQYSPTMTYNNATYYWRVRTLDTGTPQHQGPWSDKWLFKRSWLEKIVPLYPIGGIATASARFEWAGVAHASYYEFQISVDPNFGPEASWRYSCTTFNTTFTPHQARVPTSVPNDPPTPTGTKCDFNLDEQAGLPLYWRVRAVDMPAGVFSVFSDVAHFFYNSVTSVRTAPVAPTLTGPADGASTPAPVLTWDRLQGCTSYQVTIIGNSNGAVTTATTYSTSFTPVKALDPGSYTWHVLCVDFFGVKGLSPSASSYRHFTITAPAATASLNPISVVDSAGGLSMPSLRWMSITGAKDYEVYAGVAGSGVVTRLSGTAKLPFTAFTATTETLHAGAYNWYVVAYNANHIPIGTSSVGIFIIAELDFATYVKPDNCTLASCPTIQTSTPELAWNPVVGAGAYWVWVALDKDFTNIVRGYLTEHTTLTPRAAYLDNAAGQSYFWYVQPCKSPSVCGPFIGPSLASHVQAFRKKSAPAELIGPPNTVTTNLTDVVSFSWTDYAQTSGARTSVKGYRLQVAIDSAFNTLIDDVIVDQTSYQAWIESYPDSVYYWRVHAIDGADSLLTSSEVRTFQKVSQVPVPAATTTTGLPTLSWPALAYASGYAVEIYEGTNALFPISSRVLAATTKQPAYTPSIGLSAGTYSWRVRKLDPDGNGGPWSSSVATFTVSQTAPSLTAPVTQAKIMSNDLLFSWQAVTGASAYLFESSGSSSFSPVVEQVSTVMTSWAPTKMYPDNATYYWRVKVLNGEGNVMATSAARSFSKDAIVPTVTSVSPTADLAVNGTITVTFSESVKGVSATGVVLKIKGTTTTVAGTVTPGWSTPTSQATFTPTAPLVPGQYYDLTVGSGITDITGNPVKALTTSIRTALTMENTSPALTERWDIDQDSAASGGSYMTSSTAGARANFIFTGTSVSVLGRTASAGGNADIYLDGVKQTTTPVSFYSAYPAYQKTMFAKTGLTNAKHTLLVVVLGSKPAGSTGTAVDLDAFVSGTTYQETNPAVTTLFVRVTAANASGGSFDSTAQEHDVAGAEYRFSFRGVGFTWLATKMPTGGSATVVIDGVSYGSVPLYSSSTAYKSSVFTSPTLTDGVHSVKIIATGVIPSGSTGTNVTLDSVTVR